MDGGRSGNLADGVVVEACDPNGRITARVTLPAAAWERVTDWINDLIQHPGMDRPDLPLDERIAGFLDLQVQTWDYDARQRPGAAFADADPDDPVPF